MSKVSIDSNGKLLIEDGRILYRNFSGTASDFNHEGDRNFNIIIDDPELAQRMTEDGWNVKAKLPRDPQDTVTHHIKVNVNYRSSRGPRIFVHSNGIMRELTVETVNELDQADIVSCDALISPFHWERNGSSGLSAYLDTLHVVLREDPFMHKYEKPVTHDALEG